MKRAPEMSNDWCLKQAETERREEKKNVFIRNDMWMARSCVLALRVAECREVNLCFLRGGNTSERLEGEKQTQENFPFSPLQTHRE